MEIIEAKLVEPVDPVRRPWGFWATIGLSLAVIVTFFVVQTVVTFVFIGVSVATDSRRVADPWEVAASGLLLAIATWTTTPVCLALIVVFAKIRRGWSVREYLALNRAPLGTFALWLSLTFGFVFVCEAVSYLLGRPMIQEYTRAMYETAYWPPLLWSALVVAAPLLEETLFRGFMYRGIESSRLGVAGACIITGFVWTALHVQYDLFVLGIVFLGGLLFGIARWKSQSLYVTMAMHFLWNLISIVEYEVYVR